jgi:hypothetical protein
LTTAERKFEDRVARSAHNFAPLSIQVPLFNTAGSDANAKVSAPASPTHPIIEAMDKISSRDILRLPEQKGLYPGWSNFRLLEFNRTLGASQEKAASDEQGEAAA